MGGDCQGRLSLESLDSSASVECMSSAKSESIKEQDLRGVWAYLSWITVAYILCFTPLYLVLTLSPFEPLDNWGLLLLFGGLPASVGSFVVNSVLAVTITLVKRREQDSIHRELYRTINLQWMQRTFMILLATAMIYNLLVHRREYRRVDAIQIIAYVVSMPMPLSPFLFLTSRSTRNTSA